VKHLTKVFLVDDGPRVLEALEATLVEEGYDVRCFTSAEDFLAQYHPTQVGCIVIDLFMLDTGRRDLVQHLQETGSLLSVVNSAGLIGADVDSDDQFPPIPLRLEPFEAAALLTMVEDAVAGSVRRRAKGQGPGPRP
jgi:DNA-binding NtrC family response regulator